MNYINSIERYHEFQSAIRELLASIISGIAEQRLLTDDQKRNKSVQALSVHYPFIDLLYTLNPHGVQTSENITRQGLICSTLSIPMAFRPAKILHAKASRWQRRMDLVKIAANAPIFC